MDQKRMKQTFENRRKMCDPAGHWGFMKSKGLYCNKTK